MPLFYDFIGSDLQVYRDPQQLTQADLQAQRDTLQQIQRLDDALRTTIASNGLASLGIPSFVGQRDALQAFDDYVTDDLERVLDILDYFDYSRVAPPGFLVADGTWFVPEAVEAFNAEEEGAAALAIDGVNSTGWRTNATPASITFRLRSYRKNVESIRLWIPANTLPTELQGLTIRAAQALNMIDEPQNVVASGLNLAHTPGKAFQVVPFDFKKRCRYIKLDIAGSNHPGGDVMIRSIEARVTTFQHSK